jgi:hypothetical protein
MTKHKGKTRMVEQPEQTLTSFLKTLPPEMSAEHMYQRAKRAGYTKTTKGSVYAIRHVLGYPNKSRSDAQKEAWAERKKKAGKADTEPDTTPKSNGQTSPIAADSPTLAHADAVFLQAVHEVGLERATFLIGFIRSAKAVRS